MQLPSGSAAVTVKPLHNWLPKPALLETNYVYVGNNSGTGCILSIDGIQGYSLSAPLCDGGSDEGEFSDYTYVNTVSVTVNGYGYNWVDLYAGGEEVGHVLIYGYGTAMFDMSYHQNEDISISYYSY